MKKLIVALAIVALISIGCSNLDYTNSHWSWIEQEVDKQLSSSPIFEGHEEYTIMTWVHIDNWWFWRIDSELILAQDVQCEDIQIVKAQHMKKAKIIHQEAIEKLENHKECKTINGG